MKRIIITATIFSLATFAQMPGSIAFAAGDPVRGKQLAVQCFACHGEDGDSPSPVIPKIGGQHAQYLLLAMQAYVGGARPNSLMSGAVLDKSEQDLEDLAAYFSARQVARSEDAPKNPKLPGPGMAMQFDHGERDSEFTSMLARARDYEERRAAEPDETLCRAFDANAPIDRDRDGDGLPDRFDAAPADAGEFVADRNEDGYFEICNIRQLAAIATLGQSDGASTTLAFDTRRTRSYQLVTDLNAAGIAFEPIGNCGPTGNCMRALGRFGYSGVFDGRGHVIRNLSISAPERGGVGLFGVLGASGIVMHLKLENVRISGRAGVGAIVGSNFGTLYECSATGETSGMMAIGGIVGGSAGLVYAGYFSGRVDAKQAAGGLVGDMTGAVFRSAAEAEIAGTRGIGGLVGLNTFGSVLDSYATGTVSGSNDIGGLIGVNTDAKVRNSYATGRVLGDSTNIGGLVGFNSQSIVRNGYATGDVSGADAVGGLVGRNKGVVTNGYAVGSVTGVGETGDVVGVSLEGTMSGTYSATTANPVSLTGEATGWAPDAPPASKPMQFYCDRNGDGFIAVEERTAANYVWNFGGPASRPEIRCADMPGASVEEERISTAKPFVAGDIFVAATVMDVPDDDHAGTGRLLQFGADLKLKGVLWIRDTTHKIGGLAFGPDGTLWGSAPISWQVIEIDTDATQKPIRSFAQRPFSSVTFAPDGTLLFGEHLIGGKRKITFNTTQFDYLPGEIVIGRGNVLRFSTDGRFIEEYATDTHGGVVGIHGVTSTVLTDDGKRMIYISETGNRVMQYDLESRRQLPDLVNFGEVEGAPAMVLVMTQMPDGRLVIGTGTSVILLDQYSGKIVREIKMDRIGWAAVAPSTDPGHLLLGNFFDGEFVKLRVSDGEIVARNTIGEERSLSGIAQFPGRSAGSPAGDK